MVGILNLWIFYIGGYAIAYPLRIWAEKKRGMPFEDPDLTSKRRVMIPAAIWVIAGLAISVFVPIRFGALLGAGLVIAIIGFVLVGIVFYSFANQPGLATQGIHRYSRNPNYIGWTVYFLGLTLIGWSESIWSVFFLAYLYSRVPSLECTPRGEISHGEVWRDLSRIPGKNAKVFWGSKN